MKAFEYDVSKLKKLKNIGSRVSDFSDYIKVVELTFRDREYSGTFEVKCGGNIVGANLLEFSVYELLDQNEWEVPLISANNTLLVDDEDDLMDMLVCFEVIDVYKRGER